MSTWPFGNLPADTTELVGRDVELTLLRRLLTQARLVTVVGPGGVGKSRLARAAAARAEEPCPADATDPARAGAAPDAFPDGVWLADCSALVDPELLGHTLIEALDLVEGTARPPHRALVEHLAERELLLVLDGCEHLLPSCAELVAQLLAAAPGLRVLATSRQPLGAPGEHLLPLTPLPCADADSAAVRLFAARAAAVSPGFALTERTAEQVLTLCRRLDGIPLALELAAGRLRGMGLADLLARLDDRFRLLAAGTAAGVLPRHRTLRLAIGWSHELCSPQERLLWSRLSVFPGPFDLDAAEYVCAGGGLDADSVLHVLADLVDKSILVHEDHAEAGSQYWLLDTVRAYGADWLRASGDERRLRRRHRDWYLGLASWGELEWFGPRQGETAARTNRAHPHLRAALEHSLAEPGEEQTALLLAGTLWFHWVGSGRLAEGRHWLDRALELSDAPTEVRAKALWVCGYLATLQGDLPHAARVLEECRSQAAATGDDRALAYAVHRQGCLALIGDDLPRAVALFREALWRYEQIGELNSNVLMGMFELGLATSFSGDAEGGRRLAERVCRICEEFGEEWAYAYGLYALAYASWSAGDLPAARERMRACVELNGRFRDLVGLALGLELAALLATEPDPDGGPPDLGRAARLNGAADTVWRRIGPPLFGSRTFRAAHAHAHRRVAAALPEQRAAESFRRGAALGLEQAVALALAAPKAAAAPAGSVPAPATGPETTGTETTGTEAAGNDRTPAAGEAAGVRTEPVAGQRE